MKRVITYGTFDLITMDILIYWNVQRSWEIIW